MISMATAEDKEVESKHAASDRKKKQLEDAEKEHDRLVKEEEEEDEEEARVKEEKIRLAEQQRHETEKEKEHEDLLKSLTENSASQLKASLNLDELETMTEQQLVDMTQTYNQKTDGGLFSQMENKIKIHEDITKTANTLKAIKEQKKSQEPSDKMAVQLNDEDTITEHH